MIRKALLHVYPVIKQNNIIQIWERKGYELATENEKENTP